jgi:UDP-N-acetylglucosamine 2-epimerase (non-hydrolysing)
MGARVKRRILLVFGTRPEAIKMAPVYRALREDAENFEVICCVTAQHRALLDQVLAIFGITPDYDLDLLRAGHDLTRLHAAMLGALVPVFGEADPDIVLVHGDTTTALAAATGAFYADVPVGHVEAGLRSRDMGAPFPEEFNRRVVDMIAQYRFAPTEAAKRNLLAEGCEPASILVTGNTVIDAVRHVEGLLDRDAAARGRVDGALDAALGFAWRCERYVLITCHRRENLDARLGSIAEALLRLAAAFPAVHFVLPLHPNPAAGEAMKGRLGSVANIVPVEALPYDCFLQALRHCHLVLSDSGGLQEEALALGRPILIMREVTERPEAVDSGGAQLTGTDADAIFRAVCAVLDDPASHARMAAACNPFGDGKAAQRIAAFLKQTRPRPLSSADHRS